MNASRLLFILAFCACACLPSAAYSTDSPSASPAAPPALTDEEPTSNTLTFFDENAENQSWKLTADTLKSLNDGTVLEAEGNVFLQRGLDYLKADYARYYPETNWVYVRGAVDVRMGKDRIRAESAEFDLRSRTGWLNNGSIFMEGPHMYFTGERIVKHRGDRYSFSQAKITACDGDVPAWSVTAEEATVEIDGYATLHRSAFQIMDTPVIAAPFMIVPAKTTRQSGFLIPDYGMSSKRGFYYTQPYFQVIDDSRDITFYATMMEKQGPMASIRYRSQTTAQDKTWFMGSALAAKLNNRNPADDPTGNALARSNWDRYWLRGMADGYIASSSWRYRLNLDYASDQNYLRQFSSGPIGFDRSRSSVFEMFGRDLREDNQKRLNTAAAYRNWDRFGLAVSMRYEQDAMLGNGNRSRRDDETVQQLPKLEAFLYKSRIIPELPFEMEMHASTAYMYRNQGTRGARSELYPRVSLPWDLHYASLLITGGMRGTFYNTGTQSATDPMRPYERFDSDHTARQTKSGRAIPDLDVQLYTEAQRVWDLSPEMPLVASKKTVGNSIWTGLRHQIQPRVRYRGIPNQDQQSNPFYMLEDRLRPVNELTYSITNVITRRASTVTAVPGKKGEEPTYTTSESYADLLWWKLQAGYDYEEQGRTQHRDDYSRRPFMDVYSELELSPLSWLSYTNKLYISPNDGDISRYDHNFNIVPWSWVTWSTGLSYRTADYELRQRVQYDNERDVIPEAALRLMSNRLILNLNDTWGLQFEEYRNLRTHDVYDQSVSLSYTEQCYRFITRFKSDDRDNSITFYVELPGLFE